MKKTDAGSAGKTISDAEHAILRERVLVLSKEYQEKIHELSLIRRVVDLLLEEPVLKNFCLELLNVVLEEVPCDRCSFFLMNAAGDGLILAAARGQADKTGSFYGEQSGVLRFAVGEGIAGYVAQHKKTMCIGDADREKYFIPGREIGAKVQVRSLLCLPLIAQKQVLGVLNLSSSAKDTFSPETERLMKIIAMQAAMILRNVELFEGYRGSNEQLKNALSRLQEAEQKLQASNRKLERDVEKSGERYRTLFENAADGVVIHDSGGSIILANPAFARMLKYPLERLIGSNLRRYLPVSELRRFEKEYIEMVAGAECRFVELEFRNAENEAVNLELAPSVLKSGSQVMEIQVLVRDMTERKEIQRQKAETEKLAAMGKMISGVAHELNNPLSLILGYLELLMERRLDISRQKDYLDRMHQATMRGVNVVENLLGFARRSELKKDSIDVAKLLDDALANIARDLTLSGVTVRKKYPPVPVTVSVDSYLMQRVFINILKNSVDAFREKRTIPQPAIDLEIMADEREAVISFRDNGPGIAPGIMDSLFQPFVTTKRLGRGTGLGLALCEAIIREHRGRIYAEKNLERGACFKVHLPVSGIPSGNGNFSPEAGRARTAVGSALIIEDEADVAAFQKIALEERGMEVQVVNTGRAGFDAAIGKDFDVIILDMRMPGEMTGSDVYRMTAEQKPSLASRFVFVTGDIMSHETQEFIRTTPCLVIPKPFKLHTFLETVFEILSR